ncbi:MAG TPA: hypothetical protein ENK18_03975 [Deltaproteobacteria bacterium]|nr:hypothetical protein [Deltaproteobacteria bacterium]
MRWWSWVLVVGSAWTTGCEQCETFEPAPSKVTLTFLDEAGQPVTLSLLERVEADATTEVPCAAEVCTLELTFTGDDLGTTLPLVFIAHYGADETLEFDFELKISEDTREYCGFLNINLEQTITVPAATTGSP